MSRERAEGRWQMTDDGLQKAERIAHRAWSPSEIENCSEGLDFCLRFAILFFFRMNLVKL
jgi:hypothetical protein